MHLLSRKVVQGYVAALSTVQSDFLEQIRTQSQDDAVYQKQSKQVEEGGVSTSQDDVMGEA